MANLTFRTILVIGQARLGDNVDPGGPDRVDRFFRGITLTLALLAVMSLVGVASASPPMFTDQTASAGLGSAVHQLPGNPQGPWAEVIGSLGPMIGGGAVGDFNNDGLQDLFFLSGGVDPDRLYINTGHGTFTDQAAAWGVDRIHVGAGAAVGDYDGNGWLDIYVTSWGPPNNIDAGQNLLYRNTGTGSFVNVAGLLGVATTGDVIPDGMGASFGDYDLDGDLDLAVAGYLHLSIESNFSNKLFQNNGLGFSDITNTGTDFPSFFFGFAPRFVDMDDDRYPELLWVGDFGAAGIGSKYFENIIPAGLPINYKDVTVVSGTGLDDNGMGHTVADFDNDGLLDWYVTSIFIENDPLQTGNKLYLADVIVPNPPFYQYMHYNEIADTADVDDGGWGWGTAALDVNQDGRIDIVETNGWQNDPDFIDENMYLFVNSPVGPVGPFFFEMAVAAGLTHTGQGRGLLNFDYDNDGDQDIVVFSNQDSLILYRNEIGGLDTNWILLFLDTSADPAAAPNGFGARVYVTTGSSTQLRQIDSGTNYLTQSEMSAHFGLGTASMIDTIRIVWPIDNGTLPDDETFLFGVRANQRLTISIKHGDVTGDGCIGVADLLAVLAAFGSCPGCPEDLNFDGVVDGVDVDIVLANWDPCP